MLAAAYSEKGNSSAAQESVNRVKQYNPFFDSVSFSEYSLFQSPDQKQRLLAALTKAGLE